MTTNPDNAKAPTEAKNATMVTNPGYTQDDTKTSLVEALETPKEETQDGTKTSLQNTESPKEKQEDDTKTSVAHLASAASNKSSLGGFIQPWKQLFMVSFLCVIAADKLYSLVFHTVELLAFSNIAASLSAKLLAISTSNLSEQMLHSDLLILFSKMPVTMFHWCQKLHSRLLTRFAVMPIAISHLLGFLDILTLLAVLLLVMVCFLLLLSYMCRMATNLFGKAVPASTSMATYSLDKPAARDYEELAEQILMSGILVYINILRLAFRMVFAMVFAEALAVALVRKKFTGFQIVPCVLLVLRRMLVLGWTVALSGKIALARARKLFSN
jgi:hypothetical protein